MCVGEIGPAAYTMTGRRKVSSNAFVMFTIMGLEDSSKFRLVRVLK